MDFKEIAQRFSRRAQAESIERVVVILGLPRSGTTLAGALLGSHPLCTSCFEPWNSGVVSSSRPRFSIQELFQAPGVGIGKQDAVRSLFSRNGSVIVGNTLVIKETSVHKQGIRWTGELLNALPAYINKHVLWSVRCLANTYLSHIHRSRSWWGRDISVSVESYETWASRSFVSMAEILAVMEQHNGIAYSYAALCKNPQEFLESMMPLLGLKFEDQQLAFFNSGPRRIRGDRNVKFNPQEVSTSFEQRREQEWEQWRKVLSDCRLDRARDKIDARIVNLDTQQLDLDRNWITDLGSHLPR